MKTEIEKAKLRLEELGIECYTEHDADIYVVVDAVHLKLCSAEISYRADEWTEKYPDEPEITTVEKAKARLEELGCECRIDEDNSLSAKCGELYLNISQSEIDYRAFEWDKNQE